MWQLSHMCWSFPPVAVIIKAKVPEEIFFLDKPGAVDPAAPGENPLTATPLKLPRSLCVELLSASSAS